MNNLQKFAMNHPIILCSIIIFLMLFDIGFYTLMIGGSIYMAFNDDGKENTGLNYMKRRKVKLGFCPPEAKLAKYNRRF